MFEIERKFLVNTELWQPQSDGLEIKQGYLSTDKERVVRVRTKGNKAFLTIKGKSQGISRVELEYEIPVKEAKVLLQLSKNHPIEKTRFVEQHNGKTWEIDIFENENEGLVLAEVELESENEEINLPTWVTKEVSEDHRYFNAWLSENPFCEW